MQTRILECGKIDFLASFTTMRTKTFKKFTIFLVFRKTDLISYNPEIVLQKIRPANSKTTPFSPIILPLSVNLFSGICNKTPQQCKQVVGQACILLNTN